MHCNSCGKNTNAPLYKGTTWLEIILWILYIIPGLVYSIWRRSGGPTVCPFCKNETLIPVMRSNENWHDKTGSSSVLAREEIECPWCAEMILAKAKLCKHCGKNVNNT